jgi:hypothetical protein
MFKEGEINNSEQEPLKIIQELPADDHEFHIELSKEDKIDVALEKQDAQLNFREKNCGKKTLSGLRKWLGVATVMGASLLAVGCNAEKSNDGFTDNVHQNVEQRVKNAKAQIEWNKKMKNYKPGVEAKQSAKEMQENQIIQPIQENNGFIDQDNNVQRPSNNVEQGPTGRVSNPEDL